MTIADLLASTWPFRWLRSATLLLRGVRVHPSTVMRGRGGSLVLGRRVAIGARGFIEAAESGRIVFGDRAWLSPDVEIQTSTELRIGDGTTIQKRSTLIGTVRLGRGCILAPNIFISSRSHPFRVIPHLPIREQERRVARDHALQADSDRPVSIQDDCWLGANVVVSPGVTVGKGSVVGANSVVTKDVAPYSVVGGAPARLLGNRLPWRPGAAVHLDRDADRVYVLSGRPVADESGAIVSCAPGPGDPVMVAMASAPTYSVSYRASARARIKLLGREIDLAPGEGRFDAASNKATADGVVVLVIEVSPGFAPASVEVIRIEAGGRGASSP